MRTRTPRPWTIVSLLAAAGGARPAALAFAATASEAAFPKGTARGEGLVVGSPEGVGATTQTTAFSAMQNLELDLGAQYGLTPSTMDEGGVGGATLRTVMQGAEKRSPEALYFLGLLRLYGQGGLPEDHGKGVASIREAAELGHVEAQAALGMLMLHGVGQVSTRAGGTGKGSGDAAALAWIRKAANSENRDAQWMLGKALLEAEEARASALGVPGRFGEALAYFNRAAAQDAKEAHFHLALMHEYGKGVAKDFGAAQRLYRRASQAGHVGATYHLGLMVAYGRGSRQDYREAFSLFQEAAAFRSAPATYMCGVCALYGHGLPVDYNQALLYFEQAAGMGDKAVTAKAAAARDELTASLLQAKEVNEGLRARYAGGGEGSRHFVPPRAGSTWDRGSEAQQAAAAAYAPVDPGEAEDEVLAAMEAHREARRDEPGWGVMEGDLAGDDGHGDSDGDGGEARYELNDAEVWARVGGSGR